MLELEDFRNEQSGQKKRAYRAGESSHPPFRSERFFNMQSHWYYTLRGGQVNGPFPSRESAVHELHRKLHIGDKVGHNWETHTI